MLQHCFGKQQAQNTGFMETKWNMILVLKSCSERFRSSVLNTLNQYIDSDHCVAFVAQNIVILLGD